MNTRGVLKAEQIGKTTKRIALHSVSAGYVSSDYNALVGWKEGVVEQLQRLLRSDVLDAMGIVIAEEVFEAHEATHLFNVYISALEQLRNALAISPLPFYLSLLRTPIKERPAFVLELGNQREQAERVAFIRLFSIANAALKG